MIPRYENVQKTHGKETYHDDDSGDTNKFEGA